MPTSAGISAPPITTALRSSKYFHLALAARESHHSTYLSQRALRYSLRLGSPSSRPAISSWSFGRSTRTGRLLMALPHSSSAIHRTVGYHTPGTTVVLPSATRRRHRDGV